MDLSTRQRTIDELMDDDTADPAELRQSLRFIRRVNGWLGYTRGIVRHLERFSRSWQPGETIRLIDLATGSADIPQAILRWADRRGLDIRIVAVERHPVTVREAQRRNRDPRLTIVQADVFALPFAPASFDYALCSMFLHHLEDVQVVELLRGMDRLAARGLIVADLLRNRRALTWVKAMTLFSGPMIRHDARVSVAQAFTQPEITGLRDQASLKYLAYFRHFGHRFVLAGEKPHTYSIEATAQV